MSSGQLVQAWLDWAMRGMKASQQTAAGVGRGALFYGRDEGLIHPAGVAWWPRMPPPDRSLPLPYIGLLQLEKPAQASSCAARDSALGGPPTASATLDPTPSHPSMPPPIPSPDCSHVPYANCTPALRSVSAALSG